jgi:hypothetical protein
MPRCRQSQPASFDVALLCPINSGRVGMFKRSPLAGSELGAVIEQGGQIRRDGDLQTSSQRLPIRDDIFICDAIRARRICPHAAILSQCVSGIQSENLARTRTKKVSKQCPGTLIGNPL